MPIRNFLMPCVRLMLGILLPHYRYSCSKHIASVMIQKTYRPTVATLKTETNMFRKPFSKNKNGQVLCDYRCWNRMAIVTYGMNMSFTHLELTEFILATGCLRISATRVIDRFL